MIQILAIESSCDESSISIINDDQVLSTITFSQEATFFAKGGVIPELASRLHEQNLPLVLEKIITDNNLDLTKLKAVAVTTSPGLIGCLQMGLQMAKTISYFLNIPLISVHHLIGHIFSGEINYKYFLPALALVVSGGNTQLVLVKSKKKYQVIGQTLDDAVGEAFDKVASILKLGYPGGPIIDKIAQQGISKITFPVSNLKGLNFSYSGLKTAVLNYVNKHKCFTKNFIANVASSFQLAAITQLVNKTKQALAKYQVKQLLVVGGVSANSLLRTSFQNLAIPVVFPKLKYCPDNAAMIAKVAYKKFICQKFCNLSIQAKPNQELFF